MTEIPPQQFWAMAGLALIGGLMMGFLHYILPEIMGRKIGPPWTYAIGVGLGILAPFTIWVILYGRLVDLLALCVIVIGAGLFTMVGYYYDRKAEQRRSKREREERIFRQMQRALRTSEDGKALGPIDDSTE